MKLLDKFSVDRIKITLHPLHKLQVIDRPAIHQLSNLYILPKINLKINQINETLKKFVKSIAYTNPRNSKLAKHKIHH
jgi:hypothetical protein